MNLPQITPLTPGKYARTDEAEIPPSKALNFLHPVSERTEEDPPQPMYFVSFEFNRQRCVFGPFDSAGAAQEHSRVYKGERNLADNFCLIRSEAPRVWLVTGGRLSGHPCFHGPFLREDDAVQFAGQLAGASVHEIRLRHGEFLMDGIPARLPGPPCLKRIEEELSGRTSSPLPAACAV